MSPKRVALPIVIKTPTIRQCFIATIVLGLFFLFLGLCVIPVLPWTQLDAVLTQEELTDEALRKSTLEMLKRASGNQWLFWALGGAAQVAIGVSGLLAENRRKPDA